ncbi:protein ABHD11-like [Argiope bruennichi]|uniref:protein ABHD11-like n=1 Tax=Argiope bruennichi TaxID=94029 RepID=UPI002495807E|nr:protein ABHD11-like [Argiope bruennichi]
MYGISSKPKPVDLVYSCIEVADPNVRKDDVPLILIHGLSMNKESWKDICKDLALKTGKRVYIPDLRNHGESPYSEEYDVEAMTEDIIYLLDKLNISKAVVLGHSLGGKIAVHLALNYPTRIEQIIVEDMRPNGLSPEGLEEVIWYFRILKEMDSTTMVQGISELEAKERILHRMNDEFKKINSPNTMEDASFLPIKFSDGKCQWNMNPKLISVALNDINDMLNESTGCFDGPVLFIYGAESNFKIKEDEDNIKRLFPNAKLYGVKGGLHMVHMLPEFMDTVINFIRN